MHLTFNFVFKAGGLKFWLSGLLVAVFQQLERCISCRIPLIFVFLAIMTGDSEIRGLIFHGSSMSKQQCNE